MTVNQALTYALAPFENELAVECQIGQLLGPEGAVVALGLDPPKDQCVNISLR